MAWVAWQRYGPLSADERALVGTWAFRFDAGVAVPPTTEYRADRTCVVRYFDQATGAETMALVGTWRLSGDTIFVCEPTPMAPPRIDLFGIRYTHWEVKLVPDGPARFRFSSRAFLGTLRREVQFQGSPVGVMMRVAPAGPE